MAHILNRMTIIFKIISTLHRVNGDSPLPSQIFNHLVRNFRNIHSPILLIILLFQNHPLKKIRFEKEMEVILESQQQIQNLLNSQSFSHQTPHTPFLEHPSEDESELEKRLEVFCDRMQNMLDS